MHEQMHKEQEVYRTRHACAQRNCHHCKGLNFERRQPGPNCHPQGETRTGWMSVYLGMRYETAHLAASTELHFALNIPVIKVGL